MTLATQDLQPHRKPRARARSLLPREHGAYAQLGLPLLAALAGGRPTVASFAFALSAICAFVAHEPLLVLVGARGTRLRREEGPRAWRWGLGLAACALALGALGLAWTMPTARAIALGALVPVGLLLPFALRHRERTTLGELVAGFALAGAAAPVAVSAGAGAAQASVAWAVWGLSFAATTIVVRGLVHGERSPRVAAWLPAVVLATGAGLAAAGVVSPALALSEAPLALACMAVAIASPPPARVRTVGWVLAGATTLTAVIVAVGLRG